MKVGEWANPGGMYRDRRGKMMMPAARARMLGRIRTFFHDLQEWGWIPVRFSPERVFRAPRSLTRSEEHTSELQSRFDLVCRLLLEKKNKRKNQNTDGKY